jgi:hypothetical protein
MAGYFLPAIDIGYIRVKGYAFLFG